MFNKIISYLFPYKFKVGDFVICDDYRCYGRKCQIDRVYLRRDEPYVRLFFYDGYDKISFNVKSSKCELVK